MHPLLCPNHPQPDPLKASATLANKTGPIPRLLSPRPQRQQPSPPSLNKDSFPPLFALTSILPSYLVRPVTQYSTSTSYASPFLYLGHSTRMTLSLPPILLTNNAGHTLHSSSRHCHDPNASLPTSVCFHVIVRQERSITRTSKSNLL